VSDVSDTLVHDAASRLFADLSSPSLINAAETGTWPGELWNAIEDAGFLDALAGGGRGDLGGLADASQILRAAGRHAVPLPLAETILARFVLVAAGLKPGKGPLAILPVEHDDALDLRRRDAGWHLSGRARQVPWARAAKELIVVAWDTLAVVAPVQVEIRPGTNLAGEPRDEVVCDTALSLDDVVALPVGVDRTMLYRLGALARAAQMAGALEGAMELATRYAGERVQFGRPIAKFQAIQQQLAQLAEQVAASGVAVSAAVAQLAAGGDLFFAAAIAKIRAGEAAGKVTEVAHQVHGAIGFTHEHPLHHLSRRLWSWRDEFGVESDWSIELGRFVADKGRDGLWPLLTAR
jgi:alkylation response protein AidB-like acyl-CoA dehydrogenase